MSPERHQVWESNKNPQKTPTPQPWSITRIKKSRKGWRCDTGLGGHKEMVKEERKVSPTWRNAL